VAIPDNELLPHRALQNHLQKAARFQIKEAISYQFTPGYEPLRVQIAQRMRNLDVRCHPDDMVITQGCTEAISLCLRASTCAGDTIAVESPCYYGFLQIAESLGLKVIEIPTDPDTGMSVEALQLALQQWSIKLVLLVTRFSNPTGSSLSTEKQQQLVALLNQYDIYAIEDDIYGELSFDSRKQSVLKTFDSQGRVMYCSSYSKTIAPGLRTGWCIPGRRLETVKKLQMFNSLSGTSLTQCALASYLQHGHYDKHLRNLRRVTQLSMRNIRAAVDTHFPAETLTSNPRGGSVLWVHLPKQVNARQLKAMAEAQGISVMPGDIFSNTDHFANAIRLNCSMTWSQAIEQGLQTLGQLACRLRAQ
jgi:DNA-binding transcriptional MocR family regulator